MIKITQGEACEIECTIVTDQDEPVTVTPELIEKIYIKLGRLKKTFPDGEIYYDNAWIFPISQEESLRMKGLPVLSARVKFGDGSTPGCEFGVVRIVKGHDRRTI